MGIPTPTTPNLAALPEDVLLHILHHLPPASLSAVASLNRHFAAFFATPSIWTHAAARLLAIHPESSPHTPVTTCAQLRALADSLVLHWWVVTGLLAPGVPIHRRSGFVKVHFAGGVEVPLFDHHGDSCYVFGGLHASHSLPHLSPHIAFTFPINPPGPFPVHGMHLRLLHAVEPPCPAPTSSYDPPRNLSSDLQQNHLHCHFPDSPPPRLPVSPLSEPHPHHVRTPAAIIAVTLNNKLIHRQSLAPSTAFQPLHLHLPSSLLVTTVHGLNILSIHYSNSSTAAYWLRDVLLTPAITALPSLTPAQLHFPLPSIQPPEPPRPLSRTSTPAIPIPVPEDPRNPPSVRARSPFSPSSPRNPPQPQTPASPSRLTLLPLQDAKPVSPDIAHSPRHRRQFNKTARKPKHIYHKQNHARSPRGRY